MATANAIAKATVIVKKSASGDTFEALLHWAAASLSFLMVILERSLLILNQ